MADVAHIRPAGNDPQGHLSGRELERHERESRAAHARGWATSPVPIDGQQHEQWPNRCTTCSDDSPSVRTERVASALFDYEVRQLGAHGVPQGLEAAADYTGEFADQVRPGLAQAVAQLWDLGGQDAIAHGVSRVVASWMVQALQERHERLDSEGRWAQDRTRCEDLEAQVAGLATALEAAVRKAAVGPLPATPPADDVLRVHMEHGEVVCPCGSDDLLWEYQVLRQHVVHGASYGAKDDPISLGVVARWTSVDAAGTAAEGRVRCEVCQKTLSLPAGMAVHYY